MTHARRRSAKLDRQVGGAFWVVGMVLAVATVAMDGVVVLIGGIGSLIFILGGMALFDQGKRVEARLNRGDG